MKKFVSLLLTVLIMLSISPTVFASGYSFSINGGVVSFSCNDVEDVKAIVTLSGAEKTYQFSQQLETATQLGLPVRQIPLDTYTVTVQFQKNGTTLFEQTQTVTLGSSNPISIPSSVDGTPQANTPSMSRAIMVPYTKVYSSASLSGEAAYELKRHDLVTVSSISNGIAHITTFIQSEDSSSVKVDDVNAEYVAGSNDVQISGYIDASAFDIPLSSYAVDKQREVVELALTRLGNRGIYSQAKRYIDYYLDCAAFVAWCWYQVGVDMGSYTSCTGIVQWARQPGNAEIIWEADQEVIDGVLSGDPDTDLDDFIAEYRKAVRQECLNNGGCTCSDECICNTDTLALGDYNGSAMTEKNLTVYLNSPLTDPDFDINELQPGDLLFFNYMEDIPVQNSCLSNYSNNIQGDASISNISGNTFHFRLNETLNEGYEHVGMVVGIKNGALVMVHCSGPNSNTLQVNQTISTSNSFFEDIGLIIRPNF